VGHGSRVAVGVRMPPVASREKVRNPLIKVRSARGFPCIECCLCVGCRCSTFR
jgi:hypothetical protein